MMLSIIDNWKDAEKKHQDYLSNLIDKKISAKIGKPHYIISNDARTFLNAHKKTIVEGSTDDLAEVIKAELTLKAAISDADYASFTDSLKKVFNYAAFTNKETKPWNAYSLLNVSRCKICPYCIQSYAFTVISKKGSFRPTIDHFFSKSDYPYLALSLNNLIPSCYTCNSNLKGSKDFFKTPHLNPLIDAESIHFELEIDDLKLKLDAQSNLDLFLIHGYLKVLPSKDPKYLNTVSTFLLKHRYTANLSIFVDYLKAKKYYKDVKFLYEDLGRAFETPEAILLRFNVDDYQQYLFGPILRDLYYQP